MAKYTVTVTSEAEEVLADQFADVNAWIQSAVSQKINNCWKRMQAEWSKRLLKDETFTDDIPSNKEDFIALVTARDDYENRVEREKSENHPGSASFVPPTAPPIVELDEHGRAKT